MVHHDQLEHDPDNPRDDYPQDKLKECAESILSGAGVDQALLVTPSGTLEDGRPKFMVTDGNFRLEAVRMLGKNAPLVKCEVKEGLSRKEKLLIMGRTSEHYYPKNPIERAKLFYKLHVEEGVSQIEIGRMLGTSNITVCNLLKLIDMEEPIQEHISKKRLPSDRRVVDALLSIKDVSDRLAMADKLAKRKATIRKIVGECERFNEKMEEKSHNELADELMMDGMSPSMAHAAARLSKGSLGEKELEDWTQVRESLRLACEACDLKQDNMKDSAEPAWSFISHSADTTCELCAINNVSVICRTCPLTEFLVRLEQNISLDPNAGRNGKRSKKTKRSMG